jgi:hypothetical protein
MFSGFLFRGEAFAGRADSECDAKRAKLVKK